MSPIKFCKFHGFGNDYIVVEKEQLAGTSTTHFARSICHRHTGAGADGIAVIKRLDGITADFNCDIVNPDGSIAGFSGNGTRCAVACLYYKELWSEPTLRLGTRSGIKNYRLIERLAEGHYTFEAEIGKPKFASGDIPLLTDAPMDKVIDHEIATGDSQVKISAVNVGNPVACIFVDGFGLNWRRLGRKMETHEVFPERANIVFVKVLDRENIELRIWERGAGETSASGTCASAAAVLCALEGKTEREVSVHTPGGVTAVNWRDDDEILLTGRADFVYSGVWPR